MKMNEISESTKEAVCASFASALDGSPSVWSSQDGSCETVVVDGDIVTMDIAFVDDAAKNEAKGVVEETGFINDLQALLPAGVTVSEVYPCS